MKITTELLDKLLEGEEDGEATVTEVLADKLNKLLSIPKNVAAIQLQINEVKDAAQKRIDELMRQLDGVRAQCKHLVVTRYAATDVEDHYHRCDVCGQTFAD